MIESFIEPESPFTQAEIDQITQSVGRNLPIDYCEFVMEYGGAFVGGLVDGAPELPILSFFQASSVLSALDDYRDLKEVRAVPFAKCELGNIWVISEDDNVNYVNYYGGETKVRKVSSSFSDFVSRIVPEDD